MKDWEPGETLFFEPVEREPGDPDFTIRVTFLERDVHRMGAHVMCNWNGNKVLLYEPHLRRPTALESIMMASEGD